MTRFTTAAFFGARLAVMQPRVEPELRQTYGDA
jgi:hypothetical protein